MSLAFRKLSQQVLISSAQDVRLGVLQAQPMSAEDLNEGCKWIIIEGALPTLPLVIVLDIQNSLEVGIELGYLTHGSCDELAQPSISTMIANCLPTVFLGDVEPDYGLGSGLKGMSQGLPR